MCYYPQFKNMTKQFPQNSNVSGHNTLLWINGDLQRQKKVKEHVLRVSFLQETKDIRVAKVNFIGSLINVSEGKHRLIWETLRKLTTPWNNHMRTQLKSKDNGYPIKEAMEKSRSPQHLCCWLSFHSTCVQTRCPNQSSFWLSNSKSTGITLCC